MPPKAKTVAKRTLKEVPETPTAKKTSKKGGTAVDLLDESDKDTPMRSPRIRSNDERKHKRHRQFSPALGV